MTTPADYISNFSNDRLTIIAQALLDECYTTDDDLQSKFDSSYGIGTTRFDRQRNRLIDMPLEHNWLNTTNTGFDLVMNIDGAPFRFLSDDPNNPKKHFATSASSKTETIQREKFLQQGQTELSIVKTNPGEPCTWRFFVVMGEDAEGNKEYDIKFVGFDEHQELACMWTLSDHPSVGYVASLDGNLAPPVATPPARTTLPSEEKKAKKTDDRE